MSKEIMHEKDLQRTSTKQRIGKFLVTFGTYAFLTAIAVIVLFPFYWMIISSLKSLDEYKLAVPTFWPKQIMWGNYVSAFNTANLGTLFLNTMVGFIYDSLGTNSHGTASAAALILFGIILVVTMINLQVSKKRVHY